MAKPTSTKRPRFCQIRGFQRDREVPRKRAQCGAGGGTRGWGSECPRSGTIPSALLQQAAVASTLGYLPW